MKNSIFIIVLISCFSFMSYQAYSDYTDGYKNGYCEGWKDVKGELAICPISPIAPIPEIGKDTYKGGFIKGFKDGTFNAKKK